MSSSAKCSCEPSEVLLFPCSGGSNCGQIAHHAAVDLAKAGRGKLFCLAGMGAHVKGLIESTKAAKVLVAIDGCPALCAKKTLEHAELPPQIHLVVTELGIEKRSGHLDFSEDELALCRGKFEQQLDAQVVPISARG